MRLTRLAFVLLSCWALMGHTVGRSLATGHSLADGADNEASFTGRANNDANAAGVDVNPTTWTVLDMSLTESSDPSGVFATATVGTGTEICYSGLESKVFTVFVTMSFERVAAGASEDLMAVLAKGTTGSVTTLFSDEFEQTIGTGAANLNNGSVSGDTTLDTDDCISLLGKATVNSPSAFIHLHGVHVTISEPNGGN